MENNNNTITITPHEGQARVLQSEKRFVLAAAGIQGGKTFCGCIWSQMRIQEFPDKDGLITALSYDQLNNVVINKFFDMFPPYRKFFNRRDKTLYLPSGGKVFFRSLDDPRYVEGITAHWSWMDEADLCGYKGYLIVRGRLSATDGRLLMTSSLADNSWLAEYISRFDPEEFDVFSWASNKNPAFSEREWKSLEAELDPQIFRRRYMAVVDIGSGLVYGRFDKSTQILDEVPKDDYIVKTLMGIDWGYVDPTAIVVIGISARKNIYIMDDFEVEGAPIDLIAAVIKKFKAKYNVKIIYADPENKNFIQAVVQKINAPIYTGNRDIYTGTSLIRNLIFQNRFFILRNCKSVLLEMGRYRFQEGLLGKTEEPVDANNHCMDAMRYPLATYPIPMLSIKKKEQAVEEVPFWERRKKVYRAEIKKQQPYGVPMEDVLLP